MPTLSYKKGQAASALTTREIERLACLFLIVQDQVKFSGTHWQMAADEFDGTPGSFQFAYRAALKKLKDKKCYIDGADDQTNDAIANPAAGDTPKKVNKRKGGKEIDEGQTPPSSKKARTSKVAQTLYKAEVKDEAENVGNGEQEI